MAISQSITIVATVERREIPGLPGYFADSDGSIWSAWRGGLRRVRDDSRLKLMQTPPAKNTGYRRAIVRDANGRKFSASVHRLVLFAFVGPCPDGMEACHIDGNKLNNSASNLRWGTHAANCADRDRHGRTARGERSGFAKLTAEKVVQIRERYARGETQEFLASEYGVKHACISLIVRRLAWRHIA